jgi:D-galactarolactone cycloisomerase
MNITEVDATNLEIPYEVAYRPAWQPGLVRRSREFTIVKVQTDEGLVGYGGTDGHFAATIKRDVAPYLIGHDIYATEQHARVFRHAKGMWFIDQALWDIIGKAAGLPLHKLWGGFREKVPAYASTAELGTPENRAELARRYWDEGFRAMKIRFKEDTINQDLRLLDSVLSAEPSMKIMVDANQATNLPSPEVGPVWDYRRALEVAHQLEQRGIVWLEEPLSRYDFANLTRLRENCEIEIAGGESNRGLHEFRWMIAEGVYDIIQPDPALSEGVSQLRKIAAMTEMYNLRFVPHHGLSGLGLAATLNLVCSHPGATWLEMMYEPPARTIETYQRLGGIIASTIWIDDDGNVPAPQSPGLGVQVDESMIPRYAV